MPLRRNLFVVFVLAGCIIFTCTAAVAQQQAPSQGASADPQATTEEKAPVRSYIDQTQSMTTLALNPGDLVEINTVGVPELTTRIRVNENGEIYLPLVGYISVGGLRPTEVQKLIEKKLVEGQFVNNPHVSVSTSDSIGVTVIGEVVHQGVFPIAQARRFSDVLSICQGLKPTAGRQITLTHRSSSETRTFKYDPDKLSQQDFEMQPGDVVSVPKAGLVYVVGEVNSPAALALDQDETLSLLRAIALVRGPSRGAALDKSTILRKDANGKMTTQKVRLKALLAAKTEDVFLQPGDVLYVPSSSSMKGFLRRGAEGVMQATTQLAVVGAF